MFAVTNIQLFRERLSGKVHATILESIVGGFEFSFFQRNLKELSRKAMEVCLRVLKESNKSRFDYYSRQEQCIDQIPYYLSGLSRAHLFPTTFLEIAVYSSLRAHHPITRVNFTSFTYVFRHAWHRPSPSYTRYPRKCFRQTYEKLLCLHEKVS